MAESLLTLTTKKEFRTITIDGQVLKMLDLEDLSMVEQYRFRKKAEAIQKVQKNIEGLSDEQLTELSQAIDGVISAAVPDIGPFLPQLTDLQKLAVMNSFLPKAAPKNQTTSDAGNSSIEPENSADSLAAVSDTSSEVISSRLMT